MGMACGTHGEEQKCTHHFGRENQKEINRLEDKIADRRITLKCITKKWDAKVWSGLIWLSIGTGDGLL